MSLKLRKTKPGKPADQSGKAEKIAISLGAKRFDPKDTVVDPDFELEEFLDWRNERRKSEAEALKDCQL